MRQKPPRAGTVAPGFRTKLSRKRGPGCSDCGQVTSISKWMWPVHRSKPRRFFGGFLIAQKATRRRGGEIPQNQTVRCKPGGRGKPLPYGCQRVQRGRAGLGPAPTDGAPSRRAPQVRNIRHPPHHGGAPMEAHPKRVTQTAPWAMPHSGNGREKGKASEATPRRYLCVWFPYQALP